MIRRPFYTSCFFAAAAALLGACAQQDQPPQEDIKRVVVTEFESLHAVRFRSDNVIVSPAEAERLLGFMRRLNPSDRDTILVEYPGRVDSRGTELRRAEIVAKLLAKHGYLAAPFSLQEQAPDMIRVSVSRVVAQAPDDCPNWSPLTFQEDIANGVGSNLGCSTAHNLSVMIADPHDLIKGRDGGPATSEPAVLGQQRYRKGETKEFLEGSIVGIGGGG